MIRTWLGIGCLLFIVGCNNKETHFVNPDPQTTGITFTNTITESDDLNILDYLYFYNGGGVAVGDINNDDLPDIYFSGNQVKNKLYLNKGNLQFEDITQQAGVAGNSTWNTGAVMGDINNDGYLDIYVCAVVGINGFDGHNELFINNGDNTFTEKAAHYGLDADSYASSAAFLDYDKDGDLDLYLLNHAIHTPQSFGKAELRYKRNYETGDKLFRNDGDTFTDVSEEAGILGGINSYGLGVAIADFNQDGWPDIYVGNDFHEDDYYYINMGDGRFRESLKTYFGHTSRFSMGNDVADINKDGWPDLISLDMLPEDENVLKASEGDDNIQVQKLRTKQYGYHYQFMRNMLYVNQKGASYMETALLSGVAATDWSWSALFADFDQDTHQDLFISNGIPKRPNDLDYINFVSNEKIQTKISNTKLVDQNALDLMPSGNIPNTIFKGSSNYRFIDQSEQWIKNDTLISGASALADLDNDGDLDIVTNNINTPASIYENKIPEAGGYLKIKLRASDKNPFGIGTKVFSYHQGELQYKELYTVRGFQASSEPVIHFGYGSATAIDSLKIIWPDNTFEVVKDIAVNQTITLSPKNPQAFDYASLLPETKNIFEAVPDNLGISFTHEEDAYIDFNREKLIPYQVSDRGPALSIGDLNNDGKKDLFFGSAKFKEAQVFIQEDSSFSLKPIITLPPVNEEVAAHIEDFNGDGRNDLMVATGGGDFFNKATPLLDELYIQRDSLYIQANLPEQFENASVLATQDYDQDGDIDVFVGNRSRTNGFGTSGASVLLKNDNGNFTIDTQNNFADLGMVTDAIWDDFNSDGQIDLIVIGEWMAPTFFQNNKGTLTQVKVLNEKTKGLWQRIHPFDIDKDGDMDYLLGNWGENSKFVATPDAPMHMYHNDFDGNGKSETVVATKKDNAYYPLLGLDELTAQLNYLGKKYTSYSTFAGQSINEIFSKEELDSSTLLEVHILTSGYLKNEAGQFNFVPFDTPMQVAPITAFCTFDFNQDGNQEVLAAGNYFGTTPFHGRMDTFPGALLQDENDYDLGNQIGLHLAQKSVRHLNTITLAEKPYLLITYNNAKAEVYALKN